jgi:hypothetical protein
VDLTREIIYRNFVLNDASIFTDLAAEQPISGCVVDSVDFSDADVVQFIEKRSQMDGMDAGDAWLGARRIRMSGTLYGTTRADLFDRLWSLRAAMSPVLAQREEPGDRGYRPLYFTVPTNDADYVADSGLIDLRVLALPRSFDASIMRDLEGGSDLDSLAIPWQATFICKDPSIMGATPIDATFTTSVLVTGATGQNTGDTITKATHGLTLNTRVTLIGVTGGTGLTANQTYYVVDPQTNTFQVSLTSSGAAVAITADYSAITYIKMSSTSGTFNNRGNYICPVNALWAVGPYKGSIYVTVGDATFHIYVPVSSNHRLIRFKGEDKLLTVEEVAADLTTTVVAETPQYGWITFDNSTTWPYVSGGSSAYGCSAFGMEIHTGSHMWFYERYA